MSRSLSQVGSVEDDFAQNVSRYVYVRVKKSWGNRPGFICPEESAGCRARGDTFTVRKLYDVPRIIAEQKMRACSRAFAERHPAGQARIRNRLAGGKSGRDENGPCPGPSL